MSAAHEELAAEAPELAETMAAETQEPEPAKRKRGRPPGSKNKPKAPPPSQEPAEPAEAAEPTEDAEPVEAEEPVEAAEPAPAPAGIQVLDVEFDEGPGGAGPPPRTRSAKQKHPAKPPRPARLPRAQSAPDYDLLHYVAEAARAYGAQERRKRQDFYDRFLPIV